MLTPANCYNLTVSGCQYYHDRAGFSYHHRGNNPSPVVLKLEEPTTSLLD